LSDGANDLPCVDRVAGLASSESSKDDVRMPAPHDTARSADASAGAPRLDADRLRSLLLAPAGPLARLEVVESVASTNTALADELTAAPSLWPTPGLLLAESQTAGRGRSGRTWVTPAGTSVTGTFVVRPELPPEALGWLPLLAGLGVVTALRATAGVRAFLKWPNDIVVDNLAGHVEGWGTWRKLGGILTETVPLPGHTRAVLVGVGLNVTQRADELPVPAATSLALAGARHADRESVLVAVVTAMARVAGRFVAAGGDAAASGLADEVVGACVTLGRAVHVDLPGGERLDGVAERLEASGALVVRADGGERTVLAGDVLLVRSPQM
jgi:BirA family biotin operon repressor/biotin-[acetyl-CoA-carboxylase] ligase